MKSIKSIYKIGHGPSSSHTVGPYRAAKVFARRYPAADSFRSDSVSYSERRDSLQPH